MKIYQTQRGLPHPLPKAGKKRSLQSEATGIKLPVKAKNTYTPPEGYADMMESPFGVRVFKYIKTWGEDATKE